MSLPAYLTPPTPDEIDAAEQMRKLHRIRRKLNAGAALITGFRFARLFHDGDALWAHQDPAILWHRLTKGIRCEKSARDQGHWSHDHNRLIGLHQARVWLRRKEFN